MAKNIQLAQPPSITCAGAIESNRKRLTSCLANCIGPFDLAIPLLLRARARNKIMFIGNGGSAAIASHMAIDYQKNGRMKAIAFNDSSSLTCLANDLGYDHVFEHQVLNHAVPRDVLVAISSSGRSANILGAVRQAKACDCSVITLSGFDLTNPLRSMGNVNFYAPEHTYGPVEITHLWILHAMLDTIISEKL